MQPIRMCVVVKLLGIDIDYQLNFDKHIKNICRKASQQLSVLKRIGCFLSKLNKLTIFEYLKLYLLFFKTTKSFKHGGDSLYNILKHSNALVRILLICRDGTFAICKSSSYVLIF
jgi:hypothetical protein